VAEKKNNKKHRAVGPPKTSFEKAYIDINFPLPTSGSGLGKRINLLKYLVQKAEIY
jgi:hypothetical protein